MELRANIEIHESMNPLIWNNALQRTRGTSQVKDISTILDLIFASPPTNLHIAARERLFLRSRSQNTGFLRPRNQTFPLIPSSTLLQNGLSSLGENLCLSVLNTLQPVTEAATDTSEEGVDPEGFFAQKRAHFDSELPKTNGDACGAGHVSYLPFWSDKP